MATPIFTDTIIYTVNGVDYPRFEEALTASQNLNLPVTIAASGSLVISDPAANTITPPTGNTDPTANTDPVANTDPTSNTTPTSNTDPTANTDPVSNTDPTSNVVTLIGQTLTIDKTEIHIGDTFTISSFLNYSNGAVVPSKNYRVYGYDKSIVIQTPRLDWTREFSALAAGTTTIKNDNAGTTGKISVTVLAANSTTTPPSSNTTVNQPPVAGFDVVVNDMAVQITDHAFDPDSTTYAEQFDFGDGSQSEIIGNQTHTYAAAGSYTITQTVVDGDGATVTYAKTIVIQTSAVTPPPTNNNDTHLVSVEVTDAAGRVWSSQATVGNDATVAGQYKKLVNSANVEHRGLTAKFYADCVEVNVCRVDCAYDELGCTMKVTYDGQPASIPTPSNADGTLDFWRGCAMPPIRYGKQTGWDVSKIDWSIYPNYNKTPPTVYNDSSRDYTFNGLGCASMKGMGSTGERPDIGYLPTWATSFLLNPCDETWEVLRRSDDWDGNWDVFWCDPDTGGIINVDTYPDANILSAAQRSTAWNNPIVVYGGSYRGDTLIPPPDLWRVSACPNAPNGAHLTGYHMLTPGITGNARDRDHAAFWANWTLLEINPSYRRSGGVMLGAQRRAAWCLRSLLVAGFISSEKDYFVTHTLRQFEIADTIAKNPLSIMDTNIPYTGTGSAAGYKGIAWWQIHYFMETAAVAANKYTEAKNFVQYVGTWYANFQSLPQAPLMTIYFWIIHDPTGNLIPDVLEQCRLSLISNGWADADAAAVTQPDMTAEEVYNAIVARYQNAGSTFRGKFVNGVCDYLGAITASDSYPAGCIAATNSAYNAGTPNCVAAMQRQQNLPTKPDYSRNSKYRIDAKLT